MHVSLYPQCTVRSCSLNALYVLTHYTTCTADGILSLHVGFFFIRQNTKLTQNEQCTSTVKLVLCSPWVPIFFFI